MYQLFPLDIFLSELAAYTAVAKLLRAARGSRSSVSVDCVPSYGLHGRDRDYVSSSSLIIYFHAIPGDAAAAAAVSLCAVMLLYGVINDI